VHRSLSRSDFDSICCGERGRHIILGGAHRLGKIETLCQTGRDRRRQGATRAVGVSSCNAIGRQTREPLALYEEIDALRAAAMAAFDEHCLRPKGKKAIR
jgi:hypothetical protein